MAVVWIPPQLQHLTGDADQVTVPGTTVRQVIDSLETLCPGVKEWLLDEGEQRIQPGLAVVIDGEASLLGPLAPVRDDSEVHFIPAIGGG
jgi:molybdopterin synthase sulfur carrier subunit